MDVIKAIENYEYYHQHTGGEPEQWVSWRQQAAQEWGLSIEACDCNYHQNERS